MLVNTKTVSIPQTRHFAAGNQFSSHKGSRSTAGLVSYPG
jgi:hypothetical protein